MRLIDADALKEQVCLEGDCTKCKTGVNEKVCKWNMFQLKDIMECLEHAPTIDAVLIEIICEMFGNEAPCNYGLFGVSVDDFMMSKCGKWCEDNCDKVPYTECWRKFFEAIEKWRKQNG